MCASHYIFSRIDSVMADLFIERLSTGENVQKDSPMSLLRSKLIDNYTSPRKFDRAYIFGLIIRAWNAERKGRQLKQLRVLRDDTVGAFPQAI
jgi:hypothetical protein